MFTPLRHYYEFPPFCLDVGERLLLRQGEIIPLTPKAFSLTLNMRFPRQGLIVPVALHWPFSSLRQFSEKCGVTL